MQISKIYPKHSQISSELKNQQKAEKLAKDFETMLTKELFKDLYSSLKQNNIVYDSLIVDEYIKAIAPKTGIAKKALPFILKNKNGK